MSTTGRARVFISYSHHGNGNAWKAELLRALHVFERHHLLDVWQDDHIRVSAAWDDTIREAMAAARVAVFLLTPEALRSESICGTELPVLRERWARDKSLRVLPIVCEPCGWLEQEESQWLQAFQAPACIRALSELEASEREWVLRRLGTDIAEQLSLIALAELPKPDPPLAPGHVELTRLPKSNTDWLIGRIGREQELATLDLAFAQPETSIAALVAPGGVGKTALIHHWLNRLRKQRGFGAHRVYAWSFHSHGSSQDRLASDNAFLDDALRWFSVRFEPSSSPEDKGQLLADEIARQRTLLILDGIEPLQYPSANRHVNDGQLRARGVQTLLKLLARTGQPGLCVVTTRERLSDLADHQRSSGVPNGSVLQLELGNRMAEAGALLLHSPPVLQPESTSVDGPVGDRPYLDENVQFTVYRPKAVQPQRWVAMLCFAHLSELPPDSVEDEPDPVAEVKRQAAAALGDRISDYEERTEDSRLAVPREGELTFLPEVPGVQFNPPRRTFLWTESVHREEFRMRAAPELDGTTARGKLTVFLGSIVLAEMTLRFRVDSGAPAEVPATAGERATTRPFRRIFASYSHRDLAIVEEFERHVRVLGDEYLRDWTHLRAGEVWSDRLAEMIEQADVFQLFWSRNAMLSRYVEQEWRYALTLRNKPQPFVRPTYWEDPFPDDPQRNLPPPELGRLHFQRLSLGLAERPEAGVDPATHPAIAVQDGLDDQVPAMVEDSGILLSKDQGWSPCMDDDSSEEVTLDMPPFDDEEDSPIMIYDDGDLDDRSAIAGTIPRERFGLGADEDFGTANDFDDVPAVEGEGEEGVFDAGEEEFDADFAGAEPMVRARTMAAPVEAGWKMQVTFGRIALFIVLSLALLGGMVTAAWYFSSGSDRPVDLRIERSSD